MGTPYRTLLLDLGGVIIDVDYHATARAFRDAGVADFDALYSKARQTDIFDRFETGALDPAGFRDELRTITGVPLTDAVIDQCWNAMLGRVPPERITLLERLRAHFQLLMLSTTNAIHVPAFEASVAREPGIVHFKDLFHGAYYSCELGLRKPHAEAFHAVLQHHGAEPATTLFIDDSPQHVEGVRRAGLNAVHLDLEREDIVQLIARTFPAVL